MIARLLFLNFLLVAVGCGSSSEFELARATGRVTIDGKPFAWGSVVFTPIADSAKTINVGKPAFGILDANGEFELSTYGDGDGAIVGNHRVVVIRMEEGPNGSPDESFPRFKKVGWQKGPHAVSAGERNEFEIALTSSEIQQAVKR